MRTAFGQIHCTVSQCTKPLRISFALDFTFGPLWSLSPLPLSWRHLFGTSSTMLPEVPPDLLQSSCHPKMFRQLSKAPSAASHYLEFFRPVQAMMFQGLLQGVFSCFFAGTLSFMRFDSRPFANWMPYCRSSPSNSMAIARDLVFCASFRSSSS